MADKVRIFGKDTWPYTSAAREAFARRGVEVEYLNVKREPQRLAEMLALTKGAREVPVIVEEGQVTIGWEGGTWGV